jgi:hypothetical protein
MSERDGHGFVYVETYIPHFCESVFRIFRTKEM